MDARQLHSAAVAAWTVQALSRDYDVSLATFSEPSAAELNGTFGTELTDDQLGLTRPSWRWPGRLQRANTLRHVRLARFVRARRDSYDLAMSTSNEMDLGGGEVQYVHFPRDLAMAHRDTEVGASSRWQQLYRRTAAVVSGESEARIRSNVTLTNSRWTAAVIRREHGIEPQVVYPPVWSDFPAIPWEQRRDTVLMIGRLSPEKRVEDAIAIVEGLRARGHALRLELITPGEARVVYRRRIEALVRERADWALLRGELSRDELSQAMASARYGLHCMPDEHFGIAPAELVSAGCATLVHDSGGLREIVEDPDRRFTSVADAIARFERVLGDDSAAARSATDAARGRERFSAERFCDEVREVVARRREATGGRPGGRP